MVTQDQLREHLGRRPFTPFRITLHDGDVVNVSRRNQAATLRERMVVGMGNDHLKWIWLKDIDRIESVASQPQ